MPAGIYVESELSTTVIDATYKNIALRATATIQQAQWSSRPIGGFFVYDAVVDLPSGLVFIGDTSGAAVGITRAVSIAVGTDRLYLVASSAITLELFVFAQTAPSASTFGLQVFDGQESLVFDSSDRHLSVLGSFTVPTEIAVPDYGLNGFVAMLGQGAIRSVYAQLSGQIPGNLIMVRALLVNTSTRKVSSGVVANSYVPPTIDGPRIPAFEFSVPAQVVIAQRP